MPLNIVLTNDDGFDAPGIQTLDAALVSAGFKRPHCGAGGIVDQVHAP